MAQPLLKRLRKRLQDILGDNLAARVIEDGFAHHRQSSFRVNLANLGKGAPSHVAASVLKVAARLTAQASDV